jgi:autotransporter-associated beta strand protein
MSPHLRFCLGVAALVLSTAVAMAATCVWTGASSGLGANSNWSTAANWNNCGGVHAIPVDGDTLGFPDSVPRLTNNNDLVKLIPAQLLIAGAVDISGNAIGLTQGLEANVAALVIGSPTLHLNLVLETNAQTFRCSGSRPLIIDGNVNLNTQALTVNAACNITFGGNITGAGGITKTGSGNMSLNGAANTYTGTTAVNAGTLVDSSKIGATGAGNETLVSAGATLLLQADAAPLTSEAISLAGIGSGSQGSLKVAPGIVLTIDEDITLGDAATINVVGDGQLTLAGSVVGGSPLTKSGTGTLRQELLSDSQEIVSGGILEINGTFDGAGIATGAVLAGTGVGSDAITPLAGGSIAPGPSASSRPGTLSATSLNWNGDATLLFQLGSTSAASDHLDLSVNLVKSGSGTYDFEFSDASTAPAAGVTYTLVSFAGVVGFSAGSDFTFHYTGTGAGSDMTGTFALTATQLQFTADSVVSDLLFRDGAD